MQSAIGNSRSVVIVSSVVYETGLLLTKDSKQRLLLIETARSDGSAYREDSLRRWSNVPIERPADLYLLALEAGSIFFA